MWSNVTERLKLYVVESQHAKRALFHDCITTQSEAFSYLMPLEQNISL